MLTAIATGVPPAVLAELLIAAETDRVFADDGHSLDFINKSFECLDLIGWQHAADLLPRVVGQMVAARGADEATEWRQPVDLVELCANASVDLAAAFAAGRDRGPWMENTQLTQTLLGDDPGTIIAALEAAAFEGASCADLGRSLCYAAALRVAQFGTANEHGDWEAAHHAFTYCNAVHQVLKRIGGDPEHVADFIEASRAVLHGALAVYLIRYLNVPPARLWVRQFGEWGNTEPGRHILIAVARYLAAHSPTERGWLQTADIAARLSKGDQLHADEPPAGS